MCVSGFSSEKKIDLVGWHYHFILIKYLYCIFH